jgi:hypothetical protein
MPRKPRDAWRRVFLADLKPLLDEVALVSLGAASERTPYGANHLDLIRARKLKDYCRARAGAGAISECPRKPTLATGGGQTYNVDADARFLRSSAVRSNH